MTKYAKIKQPSYAQYAGCLTKHAVVCGVRLFDHLGIEQIELESMGVIDAPGVTYLDFRVVK